MEGVSREQELLFQFRRPSGFDEFEIQPFIRPVDFVADNRMAQRSGMHANLVGPPGLWKSAEDRETLATGAGEAGFDAKIRSGWSARGMNRLSEPDRRGAMRSLPCQRCING